jgi:hypothetical protein
MSNEPTRLPFTPNPGFVHNCYTTSLLVNDGSRAGHSCTATICYCYRHGCGKYNDFFIQSIDIDDDCLGTETDDQLIDDGMAQIIKDNPQHLACTPCPPGSEDWRMFRGSCKISWIVSSVVDGTTLNHRYLKVCTGGGWCWDRLKVCCSSGVFTSTIIASYSLPSTCSGCPTPPPGATRVTTSESCL